MNKERRKRVNDIKEQLLNIRSEIEATKDEEQDAFDNLPESFQGGEKGDKMNEAIENLDQACSSLDEIDEYLELAIQ